MATLNTQSFNQIVQGFTSAAQAASTVLLEFTVGTVNLAYAEAVAFVALWLQGLVLSILALTRAATSSGSDLDSWMADFNFARLPGVQSSGTVNYSRVVNTAQAVIPVGATFQIQSGGRVYAVILDASDPNYSASLGGYLLAIGTSSIAVPAQCTTAGVAGNLNSTTQLQMTAAVPGVDAVSYGSGFTNGIDVESDANYRARFPLYLASLASADTAAIEDAIINVQQGLANEIIENKDHPGLGTDNGSFFVVIDDGSGSPSDDLLQRVGDAIMLVRACGVRCQGAYGPTIVTPAVVLNYRVKDGFTSGSVSQGVIAAIIAKVNSTPLGAGTLFVSDIEEAALAVDGVEAVEPGTTTIASLNADFALSVLERPRITGTNVTVGTY
jgi:hypothetical protein